MPFLLNNLPFQAYPHFENFLTTPAALLKQHPAAPLRHVGAKISGFRPLPSGTSFFLVETDYNSSVLKKYLLEKYGLLIRDASNFRGLNAHYFRLNTLTEAKNRLLLEALHQVDKMKLEPYE